ncbi:MAG TPA: GGDEF domain-containing protein, partial [Spirochaetota bacterium]|nr:GGDEF domain-containing protein [Spirochaetota bacterium]
LDIKKPQDKILEIFVNNNESEGVIITENMQYSGFLNAKSLLNILNEKKITYARETNPLTKLPGNILINQYIIDAFENNNFYYYFIYFDFDNFKPFNDKFGFRQGDRAISLFADLLRKFYEPDNFVGHIGGDDFFVGIKSEKGNITEIMAQINNLIEKFTDGVSSFYTKEEFVRGYYTSVDRSSVKKKFSLLSVSAAVLELKVNFLNIYQEDIPSKLADLKKEAKNSKDRTAFYSF